MSLEGQHPAALNSLYQEVVLDHAKKPRNKGTVEHAVLKKHLHNPTCGDDIEVQVSVGADGKIDDVKWNGRGCNISQASASMLSVALKGKTLDDATRLMELFYAMMKGESGNFKPLGEIQALSGVSKFPVRIKCATLAWHCLEEGMKEQAASGDAATDNKGGSAHG